MSRIGTVFLLFWMTNTAIAHELDHPKEVTLHFDEMGFELEVSYTTQPGPSSLQFRKDFDKDGNGILEAGELQSLQKRLIGYATFALAVTIDGVSVEPKSEEYRLRGGKFPVTSGRELTLLGRLRFRHPWSKDSIRVELKDRFPDPKYRVKGECNASRILVEPCETFHLDRGNSYKMSVNHPNIPL